MKKKRRTIELAQQTAEMFARCVAVLKPPPELTLSQWADTYRMLSAENSATPGRWHTDNAPYQREIMDAIGDQHVRKVVVMSAAQIGKTAMLMNMLGYYMHYYPAPVLVMQPTLEMGQTFSKDFLAPMIRDTPVLRVLVDTKSRYSGNTILKKNFPGGHVTIIGANSPASLASRPIKVLLCDEVDRYPASAGTEGDPLLLAQKRQTTFWDKKTVIVSTPTIKGSSRIETEFQETTREEWNVPCPKCGHYQPLRWANIVFDRHDLKKGVRHKCERCGRESSEYAWKAQEIKGHFVAANPGAAARGFHLNTLASTFCGWQEVVEKFLLAKEMLDQGDPEKMKTWVNTELGETWEEPGERLEDTELVNRREVYDAQVPEDVLVLTAGVDVQDDRFEVEVVGWGRRQGELGHPLPEDIRRYAQGTGVARFGRLPDSDVQQEGRDAASHPVHLHRQRRPPHRSGLPLHQGALRAAHLCHQGQGRPGGAIYPQPVHEQPREDTAVRFGRRRGQGAGVSAPQARAAGAEGAKLLPLPAERGGRIRRAILPGPDQREGRGAVPQGAERDGVGDQGRELQAKRAA